MKQYGRALAQGASLLALAVLLFSFPDESVEAARSSITLCLDLLIPSLFPFFVLSSLFISTGLAGACARSLEKLMIPLLGVSGSWSRRFDLRCGRRVSCGRPHAGSTGFP